MVAAASSSSAFHPPSSCEADEVIIDISQCNGGSSLLRHKACIVVASMQDMDNLGQLTLDSKTEVNSQNGLTGHTEVLSLQETSADDLVKGRGQFHRHMRHILQGKIDQTRLFASDDEKASQMNIKFFPFFGKQIILRRTIL